MTAKATGGWLTPKKRGRDDEAIARDRAEARRRRRDEPKGHRTGGLFTDRIGKNPGNCDNDNDNGIVVDPLVRSLENHRRLRKLREEKRHPRVSRSLFPRPGGSPEGRRGGSDKRNTQHQRSAPAARGGDSAATIRRCAPGNRSSNKGSRKTNRNGGGTGYPRSAIARVTPDCAVDAGSERNAAAGTHRGARRKRSRSQRDARVLFPDRGALGREMRRHRRTGNDQHHRQQKPTHHDRASPNDFAPWLGLRTDFARSARHLCESSHRGGVVTRPTQLRNHSEKPGSIDRNTGDAIARIPFDEPVSSTTAARHLGLPPTLSQKAPPTPKRPDEVWSGPLWKEVAWHEADADRGPLSDENENETRDCTNNPTNNHDNKPSDDESSAASSLILSLPRNAAWSSLGTPSGGEGGHENEAGPPLAPGFDGPPAPGDPLSDAGCWRRLQEAEQATEGGMAFGATSFRHALAGLVLAKQRAGPGAGRGPLWLPSLLEGGVSGRGLFGRTERGGHGSEHGNRDEHENSDGDECGDECGGAPGAPESQLWSEGRETRAATATATAAPDSIRSSGARAQRPGRPASLTGERGATDVS
ncbi:unnamed protein product [Pseudo-nitzschia multistriata]|uniref:Uncharacterized protein n=1 Tax=Pseudo-nitzschia multistriata TaxID=183589 RepID=A0A448ZMF8_9STRA|nr:unnamed protein product [Pseudo-nitzschia multistriata]